jgi:hypothetical protein
MTPDILLLFDAFGSGIVRIFNFSIKVAYIWHIAKDPAPTFTPGHRGSSIHNGTGLCHSFFQKISPTFPSLPS